MSGYGCLNKNVLTVDGRRTMNLPQRRQLAVYSWRVEPQPQRLGCRLLTVWRVVKLLKSHYFSQAFNICWFLCFSRSFSIWLTFVMRVHGLGSLSNGRAINFWYDMIHDDGTTNRTGFLGANEYQSKPSFSANPSHFFFFRTDSTDSPDCCRHFWACPLFAF